MRQFAPFLNQKTTCHPKSTFSAMLLVLTLLSFLASLSIAFSETNLKFLHRPGCNEANLTLVEKKLAKAAVFGEHGRKVPETFAQVAKFCRESTRLMKESETFFLNCFESDVGTYVQLIVYTIKANIRRFCGRKGSRTVRRYLKLGPCVNKYIQPNDTCLVEFMRQTGALLHIAEDRKKIPYTCCNYVTAMKCGTDYLNTVPCIRPYISELLDMYRSGTAGMSDLVCGEYNDQSDACERLGPQPKAAKRNAKQYLTPVTLFIELLQSIKSYSPILGGDA